LSVASTRPTKSTPDVTGWRAAAITPTGTACGAVWAKLPLDPIVDARATAAQARVMRIWAKAAFLTKQLQCGIARKTHHLLR
jgi:hypothetical protein